MHRGLLSEHPSAINVLTCPTHCRTLQKQTFIVRFQHTGIDRARKKILLVRSEMLGLYAKKLSAYARYYCYNIGNLLYPIQMRLS